MLRGEDCMKLKLKNIDCAHCASKIEDKIKKIEGIQNVSYNFMKERLDYDCNPEEEKRIGTEILSIVAKMEVDAIIDHIDEDLHVHHHEQEECCSCDEGHSHESCCCDTHHNHEEGKQKGQYQFILKGLDCAHCASKIEEELKKITELEQVSVTFMNKTLMLNTKVDLDQVMTKIETAIWKLEPEVKLVLKKDKNMEIKKKTSFDGDLIKIFAGLIFYALGFLFKANEGLSIFLFMISYLIVGLEILIRAVRNCMKGQVFDENFLMAIATIGAMIIGEYPEGVAVMLFYQIGEYFQHKAVEKSRKSISSLMDIRPDVASVIVGKEIVAKDPLQVCVGDFILVKPGEKIPLDGIVIKGKSSLDTSALTGESSPHEVEEGVAVLSGTINLNGVLEIQVTSEFANSTVSRILAMVESAGNKKAVAENFITRFARIYTPIVVVLACIIGFVLPLMIPDASFTDYIYRALSFLVVSCPCALVISVPLSYFAGIGGLSRQGILVKGSSYLDSLTEVDTFVFDKTGTLTEGRFKVTQILADDPEDCLKTAAMLEKHSNHPLSQAIVDACLHIEEVDYEELEEIAGRGMRAVVQREEILAGNDSMMREFKIHVPKIEQTGTCVYVARGGKYLGTLVCQGQIKVEAKETIEKLQAMGKQCIMLTGDTHKVAAEVARQVKIETFYAELLPQDKVAKMEEILVEKTGKVSFVGDGINDAPVLMLSDLGFAMGALGSDAAIEAADIVLMNDNPKALIDAIAGAKKTKAIVIQNIVLALLIKIVVLLLIAAGFASMWEAVFADVGVSVLAICNAIRALRTKK